MPVCDVQICQDLTLLPCKADLEDPVCQVYLLKVYIVIFASSCVLAWGRLRLLAYQWLAVKNITEASLALGTLPSAGVR